MPTSPKPKGGLNVTGLVVEPKPVTTQLKLFNFFDALNLVYQGEKVTKLEWDNPHEFLQLVYDKADDKRILCIFQTSDNLFHPLKVSDGDMAGKDWVVVD